MRWFVLQPVVSQQYSQTLLESREKKKYYDEMFRYDAQAERKRSCTRSRWSKP